MDNSSEGSQTCQRSLGNDFPACVHQHLVNKAWAAEVQGLLFPARDAAFEKLSSPDRKVWNPGTHPESHTLYLGWAETYVCFLGLVCSGSSANIWLTHKTKGSRASIQWRDCGLLGCQSKGQRNGTIETPLFCSFCSKLTVGKQGILGDFPDLLSFSEASQGQTTAAKSILN